MEEDKKFDRLLNIIACAGTILIYVTIITKIFVSMDSLEKQIEERDKVIKELTLKLEQKC